MGAKIIAIGGYVPPKIVTNEHVTQWTGRDPEWIISRTGIKERRYADERTPTSELAYQAVLDLARRFPSALDSLTRIILTTSTPDRPQPATAARLQDLLRLSPVPACDLNGVCAGWLFALDFAAALSTTKSANVLLVAADKYSPILNRSDPTTVTLFGDGAGAVVIAPNADPGSGLLSLLIASHGEYADLVTVKAGGSEYPVSTDPQDYLFQMKGREVKKYVLAQLPPLIAEACSTAGVRLPDIGALICHQANPRLLLDLAAALDIDPDRVPMTAPYYGNSGSASLPLTLLRAHDNGLMLPGRPVVLCAVGGGMSVAAGVYVP